MERTIAFARWGWAAAFGALLGWSWATVGAAQPRSVIWLDHAAPDTPDTLEGQGARAERERALRLELQARNYVLLESRPRDPSTPRDQTALTLLARTTASAVIWVEADKERPVSWLHVRARQRDDTEKSPLPHPPDAIDPQLLAIAAASLLDQTLSEPKSPPAAIPTPAQAAALAPPSLVQQRTPARPRVAPLPPEPLRPHFVQLGFALPFAAVLPGMEASSTPAPDEVFQGVVQSDGRMFILFNDQSAYVPDADSFDDYQDIDSLGRVIVTPGTVPVSTACAADGTETMAPELPSKYCVRVTEPGAALVPALRLAVGTWLLPELAVSVFYQWHFTIDADDPFGDQALGVQAEYLVLGRRDRGLALAMLGALVAGRAETPVSEAKDENGSTVNVLSGPFLAKTGASLRHALRSFGAVVGSVTLGGHFPEPQLELELTLGLEYGF